MNQSLRDEILEYVENKYKVKAEYPWAKSPDYAVLRHSDNQKWFALVMNISKDKLGMQEQDLVDVINVKCDPVMIGSLRMKDGFFAAYHMNKEHWITIILDGTVEMDEICELIDLSYDLTKKK